MSKCKLTANDLVNSLWDSMSKNKKGDLNNGRLSSQAKAAGKIIRTKAEQRKYRVSTNKPGKMPFFED